VLAKFYEADSGTSWTREPSDISQVQGRVGSAMVFHAGRAMTLKMGCSRWPRRAVLFNAARWV